MSIDNEKNETRDTIKVFRCKRCGWRFLADEYEYTCEIDPQNNARTLTSVCPFCDKPMVLYESE